MDTSSLIEQMVNLLKDGGAIYSLAVEKAFRCVPRHKLLETFYIPEDEGLQPVSHNPIDPLKEHLYQIYSGRCLITRQKDGIPTSSASEVFLMAMMLELLELSPGLKVLEIGAGTGYNAALMAELVKDPALIVSTDIQEDVIAQTQRLLSQIGYSQIKLLQKDGFEGVPEESPFDRIVSTVGCLDLSPHWIEQIDSDGFILFPLTHGGWTPLIQVRIEEKRLKGKVVALSGFVPILGQDNTYCPWDYYPSRNPFEKEKCDRLPLFPELESDRAFIDLFCDAFPAGFYYYLAIHEFGAFWSSNPPGFGIDDRQLGKILISPKKESIFLSGDRSLYERLRQYYQDWLEIGRPSPFDYEIEFISKSDRLPELSSSTWTVERQFYHQVFTL